MRPSVREGSALRFYGGPGNPAAMRPLFAALLLLGLAFVAVPPASAEPVPPGPCYAKSYVDNGVAHVYTTIGCGTFVDLLETECTWGGHWTTVAGAGNVFVRVWSCDPEFVDPTASAAVAPACATPYVTNAVVTVEMSNSCQVYVDEHAGTFFTCEGTLTSNSEEQVDAGRVHVTADSCRVHTPPCTCDPMPLPDLVTASASSCTCDPNPWILLVGALLRAAPCVADAAAYAVYHSYDVNPVPNDCVVDAEPSYECLGGSSEDRTVSAGFVRVVVRACPVPLPPILE